VEKINGVTQGKDVSTEVFGKICKKPGRTIDDITEFVPEEEK